MPTPTRSPTRSLTEIVDHVRSGEPADAPAVLASLAPYHASANAAEQFLAHQAAATLGLREGRRHLAAALEAIGHADERVLRQYLGLCSLLGDPAAACGPIARFGHAAVNRGDLALGVEAIAAALREDEATSSEDGKGWRHDDTNLADAAAAYDLAAGRLGFAGGATPDLGETTRIAYIVSALADDDAATRTCVGLAKHLDPARYALAVYVTDAHAPRAGEHFARPAPLPPSERRGTAAPDALARAKVPTWSCPADGDATSAALALAGRLVEDQADVVIFDTPASDAAAALVSNLPVGRARVNLVRDTPLGTGGTGAALYLDQGRWAAEHDRWQARGVASRWVLEGFDADEMGEDVPERSSYGIPDSAAVLTTSLGGSGHLSEPFIDTAVELLRAHPHAVYLLVGGDPRRLDEARRRFEAAGVGRRVGHAGRRRDLPGFLRVADVYLAEFPAAHAPGVLGAMSAGLPVVAAHWGESTAEAAAAQLVGPDTAVHGPDAAAYIERAGRLVRDPSYRAATGHALAKRAADQFSFAQTARCIGALCDELAGRPKETPVAKAA